MTENELINKIKELKQIRPNKDWVVLTKNQILGQEDFVKTTSENSIVLIFQNLFLTKRFKPAFAIATAVLLLFIGIAGFFHLTEKDKPVEFAEVPVEPLAELKQVETVAIALEELQTEIDKTTESLRKIEEPQKVLEARNVVVPVIVAARDVIIEVEKLEEAGKLEQDTKIKQNRVLAIGKSVNRLENTLEDVTAIEARNLIQFLETRMLTEIQKEILEKAKQAYQEGNYNEALINSIFVSQLIQ